MIKKIKRRLCLFLINKIFSGTHFFRIKRVLLRTAGYKIGKNSRIVGPIIVFSNLEIGDNCWIGRMLCCEGNGSVLIEDNCDIAPCVTFLTGGHEIGDSLRRAGKGENYTIIVKHGCWICAKSVIANDTTIGESSVVAACSCVVNDVEDNSLVGGIPAKVIKKYNK